MSYTSSVQQIPVCRQRQRTSQSHMGWNSMHQPIPRSHNIPLALTKKQESRKSSLQWGFAANRNPYGNKIHILIREKISAPAEKRGPQNPNCFGGIISIHLERIPNKKPKSTKKRLRSPQFFAFLKKTINKLLIFYLLN